MRLEGILNYASGALLDVAMGAYKRKGTGEYSLFRRIMDKLDSGDVLFGDACYCGYFGLAELMKRGVEVVFEQHGARRTDNIAENELSALTRQCIAKRRIGDIEILRAETAAWSSDVNRSQKGVDWQMKIEDAKSKLKSIYPKIN